MKWLDLYLVLFFCVYAIPLTAQTTVNSANISTVSDVLLQQQIFTLYRENEQIGKMIERTVTVQQEFVKHKVTLQTLDFPKSEIRGDVKRLQVILSKLKDIPFAEFYESAEYNEYNNLVIKVFYEHTTAINELISSVRNRYFQRGYASQNDEFLSFDAVEIAIRGVRDYPAGELTAHFQMRESFYQIQDKARYRIESTNSTQPTMLQSDIASLLKHLTQENDLVSAIENDFNQLKQATMEWIDQISAAIVAHEKKLIDKKSLLDQRLSQIDAQYKEAQLAASKAKDLSSSYGTWSVNLMIVGIISILFILLNISRSDPRIADKLIERRTLVEILSMGFLLLAVIILGTSKNISGESLGTLLGTIAGYVFGKQMSERIKDEQ